MKTATCTGEQYTGQGQSLSLAFGEQWHGKFGHINVLELDHDSNITGKGAHDRVVVYIPTGDTLECRVDHVWNLGMPTPDHVLKVARSWPDNVKGRWKFQSVKTWDNGKCSTFTFNRA